MSAFNITQFPEIFGNLLGLDVEPTGIVISLVVIVIITICLGLLNASYQGIAVVNISFLAFAVLMGWFPLWILIIIILAVAVLAGRKVSNYISGSEL